MGAGSYEDAIEFHNLYKGLEKSRRNVIWKDSVAGYSINSQKNTYLLRQSLIEETYKISPYSKFTIQEPKEREIIATKIKDRQFQRSLCDVVLCPALTEGFITDNCACQVGRGVDYALNRLSLHMRNHYTKYGPDGWVLKCDVRKYFGETPHEVAKNAMKNRIPDEKALSKVYDIIDSFDGDKGIGLGSQVSQLIQLSVLDDLDHYVKSVLRVRGYVRYMDDFILIHGDKKFLQNCWAKIEQELGGIELELNKKTCIHPLSQGIRFLGWRFILTGTGKVIWKMSEASISGERRKLKKMRGLVDRGVISQDDITRSYSGWEANAKRGDTSGARRKMETLYVSLMEE